MIRTTVGAVDDAMRALSELARLKLPPALAWRVAVIVRKATEEHRTYAQLREKLATTYGDKDADGKLVTREVPGDRSARFYPMTDPERAEQFAKDLDILRAQEVVFESSTAVKLAELPKDAAVTGETLAALGPFLHAP